MLALDKTDKRILFELDKNARIPDTKLAKLVQKSKESVRYRINKLQKQNIIQGFSIWIDPTKLGYSTAKIYLTLANKPQRKKRFIEYVNSDSRLFWQGIAEGAWNVGLTYFVKSTKEFFELKNKLFSEFKDLILESRTGIVVDVSTCDKTFFYETDTSWTTLFDQPQELKIDAIEKKILKELYQNSRLNVTDIARKTKSTVDIVRNRIKKLQANKIIVRYLAKIDYNLLGYEFFKTFLYFKNLNPQDESKLREYCKNQNQIIHLVRQISSWDVELEIMCENYCEYNGVISELTMKFSSIINKVETAIMGEDYTFPAKKMIFET